MLTQIDKLDKSCSELRITNNVQEKQTQDLDFEKSRKEKQISTSQTVIDNVKLKIFLLKFVN